MVTLSRVSNAWQKAISICAITKYFNTEKNKTKEAVEPMWKKKGLHVMRCDAMRFHASHVARACVRA
jgi:hypothetical protein